MRNRGKCSVAQSAYATGRLFFVSRANGAQNILALNVERRMLRRIARGIVCHDNSSARSNRSLGLLTGRCP